MQLRQVCFSHGQESGPWGTKIRAMAEVARRLGWGVESLDYQGMQDPRERVARLDAWLAGLDGAPLLVGSSMGGFVSVVAAAGRPVRGLFLLAPALYLSPLDQYLPDTLPVCPTFIVHGWRDTVVPCDGSLRYARATLASLLLLDGDHRLTAHIVQICQELEAFLRRLDAEDQDAGA